MSSLHLRDGLSAEAARERLRTVGPNEIAREEPRSAAAILRAQFGSALIWLLLGAALVSGILGEWVDAVAIAAILAINALVGFLQEHRADQAMLALRAMT